jgi:hypothetical protein
MVANAAGGIIIALVGGVALFALDAITFLVAALLFVTVYVPPAPTATEASSGTDDDRTHSGSDPVSDGGRRSEMTDGTRTTRNPWPISTSFEKAQR